MEIKEVSVKNIIVKSKLPDADYVVNPYTGCEFGCIYCYASFMGRFVNESIDNWGNYVYVKTNAVELFDKEIDKVPDKDTTILLSSVTEPYQGAELKYRLTRSILEIAARKRYGGQIGILTKSSMVTRDIDVLEKIPNVDVGMTITTTDDELSRFLELRATATSMRIKTLGELNKAGLRTYAFVGPLLPHFRYKPELLDKLFASLVEAGVNQVYIEHINLSPYIKKRMFESLEGDPQLQEVYTEASTDTHRNELDKIVKKQLHEHGLKLRLNDVIYHHKEAENDTL
jgi:DNA repair photolyase